MSLFGGKTQASTQTVASGVTIQSSVYGAVVPVVYGQTRLTGNLIWYGGFQAIAPASAGGGKGGGSGGKNGGSSTDYKASFAFALAEGPLGAVSKVWSSKSETAFSASHLAFASGNLGQAPWGYLTTYFAGQDLAYAGTGYVFAQAYDLGSSAQLPNLSYEVTGLFANAIAGLPDADPRDIVVDILTNARYGIGFPSARLGDLSVFSNYCRAAGMVVSPLFDTQQNAATQVNQIVQDCNAEFVWSGATLTIVPYGDQNLSANGATYTAPAIALYSLTDDDFLDNGQNSGNGADPVQCSRARPSDRMNSVKLEWLNRANQYNIEIVEADDQAAIETYGLRTAQPSQSHWFCNLAAATMSATLQLQRQAVRNQYSFTLGWRYCLLDPMDIVEITDTGLGLANQWVRIVAIEEDDNGNLKVTAGDVLDGAGSAPLYSYQSGSPYIADYNAAPGSVNTPLIFEPPPLMLVANSTAAPQIMVGASGGSNWGGCDVWLSLDNATYQRMGRIGGPARQGVLQAALAAGADPDIVDTLSVDLSQSGGQLLSGTLADANAFRTLCYVDGELIAYETATLTGTSLYGLTTLRRGVYGTPITAHAAGGAFCRIDGSVVSFDLPVTPVSYVAQTLYLKFLSFNIYGGGQELLADVPAYDYTPNGAATYVAPPAGVTFTVGAEQQQDGSWNSFGVVSWSPSPDPVFDQYEVQYRLHAVSVGGGPGPWISWRVGANTTSFRISPLPPNTAYDAQVRAVRTNADQGPFYSAWAQDLNVTTVGKTTPPPAPTAINVSGGYRQIAVSWTPVTSENDIAFYTVLINVSNTLSSASVAAQVNASSAIITGLALGTTYWVWVKSTDTSGNVSTTALGPGSAATLGVEAADITGQIVNAQIAANAIAASNLISGLNLVQVVPAIADASSTTSLFAYDTGASQLYTWNGSAWVAPSAVVAAGSIGLTDFASGITPVQIVATLPTSATEGQLALLTTNGKLYRYVGGAWTTAVDGGDIEANTIETGSIAAGAINTAELAAGAITASKLAVGDTTSLIQDPFVADQSYWTLYGIGSPAVVYFETSATVLGAMGVKEAITIDLADLASGDTAGHGSYTTAALAVQPGTQYSLNCLAWAYGGPNKTLNLVVEWFDRTGTYISSSTAATVTNTAPWSNSGGALAQGSVTSPANAALAYPYFYIQGNVPSTAAGTGAWIASAFRLQALTGTTLIENGAITTALIAAGAVTATQIEAGTITAAEIAAGGITGTNIAGATITGTNIAGDTITAANLAAGTITGDKINANFFQGYQFEASGSAAGSFAVIYGEQFTSAGEVYGPYFAVNDGTRVRAVLGQWDGAYGLWLYDSSGNIIFEEASFGTGVIGTTNIQSNAVTYPYSATLSDVTISNSAYVTLWSQVAPATGVVQVVAFFNAADSFEGGPYTLDFQITIGGTVVYDSGDTDFNPWIITQVFSIMSGQSIIIKVKIVGSGSLASSIVFGNVSAIVIQR